MKRLPGFFLVCCLTLGGALLAQGQPAKPALQNGDFVAVCGDSITEQKLYSIFIEDYLTMCQPRQDLRALQAGWSGETASGFFNRMEVAVLSLKPTVATTCYGMNDGGYGPADPARQDLYRKMQTGIVQKFKKAGVREIIVGSPGCVDPNTFKKEVGATVYNQTLAGLRDIAREVASAEGVRFANVYDPMLAVTEKGKAKYGPQYHVAGADGFHPAQNGHLVMAYAFLKALGVDGHIGTITVDLAKGSAEATQGHKVLSAANGAVEVESACYPFCFYGDPKSPDATRGVIEFFPFNEELNRFLLIAKGGEANARYKVTWGNTSKEFSGAELEKGINLAAQFLDNPFSEPFRKVEQVIRGKQNFETHLTKEALLNLSRVAKTLPEEAPALEGIAGKLRARDKALAEEVSAAVVPVKHTVRIEPVR